MSRAHSCPSRRRAAHRLLLAALAATCAFLPPSAPSGAPPRVLAVRPLPALTDAFAAYAERGRPDGRWTGGDSTYSVPVRAGRLWVFSDTFLGTVRPDGSRPPVGDDGRPGPKSSGFVHNSFVLWDARGPHTLTGHDRAGRPVSLVREAGGDRPDGPWYWARAGLPDGGGAAVVYARYARTGPGPLDVAWRGNVLARFGAGDLTRPRTLTPLPSTTGTAWGAWLLREGGRTYVYGTRAGPGGGSRLYLARTCGRDLRGPWRYRTAGGGWSDAETRAAPLRGPGGAPLRVSQELSVVAHGGWYALVTQQADEALSPRIQLAWARSPGGPFTRPVTVYTAPEAGPRGTYGDADVIAYNPHEHPDLERPGELVVSYNVNSLDPRDVMARAAVYRPRFVRVRLG
ncbi:hypothetical protein [Streptomyces sp. NPDC049585]|uniref:hypothetical protein n=1 Tax=Streptomyces sp. NPDC049585 TaxID=3155154 RepID=UPI00341DDB9D